VAGASGIRRETEVAVGFQLRIEDGSYVQTVEVRTGALTVGKNPPAGLALASPGLSSRHAVFRQKGDRVELEALPTKVGVRLRGERVDRALLAPNESVQVGWATITVAEITPADESAPSIAAAEPAPSTAAAEVAAPSAVAASPVTTPLPRLEFEDGPATQPVAVMDAPAPAATPARAPAPSFATPPMERTQPIPHLHARAPVHHEPAADFVIVSRKAVRVLPWWGISIGLHAVLVGFVLMLPKSPERAQEDESDGTIEVSLRRTPEFVAPEVPVVEQSRRAVDLARPEMSVPVDTPDSTLPASADPKGQGGREGNTRVDDTGVVSDDASGGSPWAAPGGSSAIGVGSGARFGSGTSTNMDETFGKDDAGRANAAAAGHLNGDPFTRALVNGLRLRTTAESVKVVAGDYDKCANVMTALGLQHGTLTAEDVAKSLPTQDVRVIFYDCTGRAPPKQTVEHIQRWVKEGGFLFTSDWGVDNVIDKAFPGYLKVMKTESGRQVMTPDTTITFTVAPGKHVLLAGLPPEAEKSRWWLEESSILFTIGRPEDVEVLAVSSELETRYGSKFVAVTFPFGKGRVVHALGHMFQREGNLRGAYAMQRLLLNFLYQAIRTK
jgi:pSer/pThr/pTyr-binding forkhead associated (FHA) protein